VAFGLWSLCVEVKKIARFFAVHHGRVCLVYAKMEERVFECSLTTMGTLSVAFHLDEAFDDLNVDIEAIQQ